MSVTKRNGFISALQMIAAITFQLTWLGGTYLAACNVSEKVLREYVYIIRLIQMSDCIMLMFCIYAGFARKRVCSITISNF